MERYHTVSKVLPSLESQEIGSSIVAIYEIRVYLYHHIKDDLTCTWPGLKLETNYQSWNGITRVDKKGK